MKPVRCRALLYGMAACCVVSCLCIAPAAALGGSIFDDDYKPPPSSHSEPERPSPSPSPAPEPPPPPPSPTPQPTPAPELTPAPRIKPVAVGPQKPVRYPLPVPAADACAKAEKLVADVYREELAKSSAADRMALGGKLLSEAAAEGNDQVTRYVLLRDAPQMLQSGGDLLQSLAAVEKLGRLFAVDWMAMQCDVLTAGGHGVSDPVIAHAATEAALILSEQAMQSGRYDLAAKAASASEVVARKTHEPGLMAWATARAEETQAAQEQAKLIAPSLAKRKTAPQDAGACAEVGKFFCFWCGEWEQGIPLLAKSSEPLLKKLAERELAAAELDSSGKASLGDGWFDAAGKESSVAKEGMQRRACFWYRQAMVELSGLAKINISKRLRDLCMAHAQHGLIGEVYRGRFFEQKFRTRIDSVIDWNWSSAPPELGMNPNFYSIRWSGYIKPPVAGTYKILARADDCVRVWIDEKLVIDRWPGGGKIESATVAFGTDPVEIRVDYFQETGPAYMGLGWLSPGSKKPRAIPANVFYHGPVDMYDQAPKLPSPDRDGVVTLAAGQADIHGRRLSYSDNQQTGMLAYWEESRDWASWDFSAPPGDFDVEVRLGVDGGAAGGTYSILVGGAELTATTSDTGGWESFKSETIGRVHIGGGNQTLVIKCVKMGPAALLNLRAIVLTPAKAEQ